VLFTSSAFLLLFLPATIAVYWATPQRGRMVLLLVASYVFYLSWSPRYGLLLATSTLVNYALVKRLPTAARPKRLLAVAVAFNLGLLAYFKYAGLLTHSGAELLDWLGLARADGFDGLQILLPLAISFFTFEMISVHVDVYRGETRVDGFLTFATYKAFFPKLVSGPITRYRELAPQLERLPALDFDRFQSGVALFTVGLAKKLIIADNIAPAANALYADPSAASSGTALVGILAFGLQIFFDFSSYTDMARGVSRMLGFELPRNFMFPYAAYTPSDFWRRWHMSLSRFLRDYVYISLGGNRKGRKRTYVNLFATMTLGGLWHGAAWHFAVWGALHGAMLTVSHSLRGRRTNLPLKVLAWIATMTGVYAAWVLFRAETLADAGQVFAALFSGPIDFSAPTALSTGPSVGVVLVIELAVIAAFPFAPGVARRAREIVLGPRVARAITYAAVSVGCWTAAALLVRSASTPFIYFNF
jgi:alginate O-acetyltransferase complex protein AlgI